MIINLPPVHLRGIDILSGELILSKRFVRSEKGATLKEKNLLPLGANSFLLEQTPFQKELDVPELKQEVTKVVSLLKHGEYLQGASSPLKVSFCL